MVNNFNMENNMETLIIAYEYTAILLYILSGISFYFCFYLLYIAGVSRQLEIHYSKDYQIKYLESTNLSSSNLFLIWRKIHNFGLFGTICLTLTFNFFMFIPIVFVLFSLYYISNYASHLIAKSYSSEILNKIMGKDLKLHSQYEEITPQINAR